MEYVAVIISAIGTIITGVLGLWFKYNQKTKDKLTDLKIEKFKQDEEIKNRRRNDGSATVFGELWNLTGCISCSRTLSATSAFCPCIMK